MTQFRTLATLAAVAAVAACTDYATFVTATDIGINLDAKTEELNIGYVRTELFHGPGYPEQGAAPSAVGYISSDLSPFSPKIKQLYATGTAAELVTQNTAPAMEPETTDPLTGHRRPFVFGTGTNFGLKVGFTGDAPSSVKFGFNREELSIIPMQQGDPLKSPADKYASVLASINMDDTIKSKSGTDIKPTQFFATGAAARNLAKREEIRGYFGEQAKAAVTASFTGEYSFDESGKKIREFWKPGGKTVDKNHDAKLKICLKKYNLNYSIVYLMDAAPKAEKDVIVSCLQS